MLLHYFTEEELRYYQRLRRKHEEKNVDRGNIWSMYFCSVVSMFFHPGYSRDRPLTEKAIREELEKCANIADDMLLIAEKREVLWPGLQRVPPSSEG